MSAANWTNSEFSAPWLDGLYTARSGHPLIAGIDEMNVNSASNRRRSHVDSEIPQLGRGRPSLLLVATAPKAPSRKGRDSDAAT